MRTSDRVAQDKPWETRDREPLPLDPQALQRHAYALLTFKVVLTGLPSSGRSTYLTKLKLLCKAGFLHGLKSTSTDVPDPFESALETLRNLLRGNLDSTDTNSDCLRLLVLMRLENLPDR